MPSVSIIMPTLGRVRYVKRAITSVFRQTYNDWELIIVDSTPNDQIKQIINNLNSRRVKYVKTGQRGVSLARNLGIKSSKGDFIAFIDSDAIWLPKKLEKQMRVLTYSDHSYAGVYSGYKAFYETPKGYMVLNILPRYNEKNIFKKLLIYNCIGTVSTVILKREHLEQIGLFDEGIPYAEDWDLWLRISQRFRWLIVDDILVYDFVCIDGLSADLKKVLEGWKILAEKWAAFSKLMLLRYYYYLILLLLLQKANNPPLIKYIMRIFSIISKLIY